MPSMGEIVRTYRELAEIYDSQGEAQMRDRFLVLAADAALTAGRSQEAERLRGVLLQHNPHHLLKPYASLAEALKSNDVRNYVSALRRSHPYERAEQLLERLSDHAGTEEAARTPTPAEGQKIEDLQIYRVRDESGSAPDQALSQRQSGLSKPSPVAHQPARIPDIYAVRPDPPGPAHGPASEGETQEHRVNAFVSLTLLLVVLIVGAFGAIYTLIRPFLP